LRHAVANVPAYRELGIAVDSDDPYLMLAAFPLVTKVDISARTVDYCDDDIDPARCWSLDTSGTTGQPLRVIRDFDHITHQYALMLRRSTDLGLPADRKILHPYHSNLDRWFEYTSPLYGLARIAEFGAAGAEAYWAEIVERIRGYRPDVVMGHPTLCVKLCDLLDNPGPVRPALVHTWGERITPGMVRRLTEFFGAQVRDTYGLREVGPVAAQCERSAYHVDAERLYVEVVDESGHPVPDGESGEIVVTNLINRAMPLIRYRTGDVGALGGGCDCGAPQPVMRLVEGREPGVLVLPGGDTVPVMPVFRTLQRYPVRQYQVVQVATDEVRLVVLPDPEWTGADAEQLRDEVTRAVGGRARVTVDSSGTFEVSGARKATDFVSLLPDSVRVAPDAATPLVPPV
ncbi:MAG: phenylacetate--CoA ligase family protein, partial [Micromonosporaceae bacterium]